MNEIQVQPEQSASQISSGVGQELRIMFEMAQRKPRDPAKAQAKALQELTLFPDLAARAYYSIPYKDRKGGEEKTVWVEGPSIKAAMALKRAWGNSFNQGRIKEELDDRIIVQGIYYDAEENTVTIREVAVGKFSWSAAVKKMIPLRGDRLLKEIQAGISKAIRNAVLAGLPEFMVQPYFMLAKKLAAQGKKQGDKQPPTMEERVKRMIAAFAKHKVTAEQIADYMGRELAEVEDMDDKLARMIGIYNALEDGQSTVDEIFGKNDQPEASKPTGEEGQVKMGELIGEDGESAPPAKTESAPNQEQPEKRKPGRPRKTEVA